MRFAGGSENGPEELRWFVGVPLVTNRFLLKDILSFSVALWLLVALGIVSLQFFMTGAASSAVAAAVSFASLVSVSFILILFAGAAVIYRNRYLVLYRMDGDSITSESMFKWRGAIEESFHVLPFPVEPYTTARKNVIKNVLWSDINSVRPIAGSRTILLERDVSPRSKKVIMRIYCPDSSIFESASMMARKMVSARG